MVSQEKNSIRINTQNWRQRIFIFSMISCILFILLTTVAMFFYPGGTVTDPTTKGYSFTTNFFSDLGGTKAHSGDSNIISFILFITALSLISVAFILFFITIPRLFIKTKSQKILSTLGSVVGIFSCICYLGIAFTPWDLFPQMHGNFVYAAFTSFFLVVFLYAIAIFLNKDYSNFFAFVYVAFAVILVIYLWLLFTGPEIDTPEGLTIHATGQKIVVYSQIICMFIQGFGAYRISKNIGLLNK